jgi:hypothetical protein
MRKAAQLPKVRCPVGEVVIVAVRSKVLWAKAKLVLRVKAKLALGKSC